MSRLDRWLGLARSLLIYHGIPFRQRRFRQLYAGFVRQGELVIDVGGHVGNRARVFASLGARVVTVEPQPDFARLLRRLFARSQAVTVLEGAVGAEPGRAGLAISDRFPTVTTLARGWRERRAHDADFAPVVWNREVEVEVTTLDALIDRFGMPGFVKIDVEGAEPAVLAGLSRAVPALSFEYLPRALDEVDACLSRLAELGDYEFAWSLGETAQLSAWGHAEWLRSALEGREAQQRPGDVYARLRPLDLGTARLRA